ncbi:polysaccharide pyruvyl transferase CsaB [Paenibacillus sp. MER 180]|uniref:polysaccharide pyruvyl transferase CsaB n=1 Tax=Paenibacillus sp. MER 180 TaxID=2939570 RepID=UPI00203B1B0A|nr:polysaccharide pyruvyl transferase CsaB [Paenibacillus sp. MER 180]MCM3288591.1 polysaccharide pyruvyl transferase CsaB [Paenibacillus sp. MER 180]
MASKATRIVLSGYYGFNNSGDEAVLLSILTALERAGEEAGMAIEPVVLSGDPETTTRLYGVEAVHRMKPGALLAAIRSSDGLISGGGSLLQDATSSKTIPYYLGVLKLAQWFRKPTFIYSQGVGPVNSQSFYPYIRHVFNRAAYVSVRDRESAELLMRMGVGQDAIHVVPDPVMGLRLPSSKPGQPALDYGTGFDAAGCPYVGVSLRFWNQDRSDMDAIADMLLQLSRMRKVHLRFLPFHGASDEEASRYVMKKLEDEVSEVDGLCGDPSAAASEAGTVMSLCAPLEHPQSMLQEVSQCRVLVGMRLHSLIYAASQEVPLAGISYDPKIDQFLHRLQEEAIGTTAKLDAARAASHMCCLLDDVDGWREKHQKAITLLKQEAEQPAQQIVQWLRHKA